MIGVRAGQRPGPARPHKGAENPAADDASRRAPTISRLKRICSGPKPIGSASSISATRASPKRGIARQRPAESQHGAAARGVVVDRLVAVPFRLRQRLQEAVDLAEQRRRGDAAGQKREPGAVARALRFEPRLQRRSRTQLQMQSSSPVRGAFERSGS